MSIFTEVGKVRPQKRSAFDLSYENKLSLNMGQLVPFYVEEVVPGDKVKLSAQILMRFAPLLAPVMHRVNVYTHFFFVPNRLVWKNWADNKDGFITGGREGTSEKIIPSAALGDLKNDALIPDGPGSLLDYMGIPMENVSTSTTTKINILPFRGYQLIYNEFYRDQNLEEENDFNNLDDNRGTSAQTEELFKLRYRAWEKDYFTSALPWTQRGNSVALPIDAYGDVSLKTDLPSNTLPLLRHTSGDLIQNSQKRFLAPSILNTGSLTYQEAEVFFEDNPIAGDTVSVTQPAGLSSNSVRIDPNGTLQAHVESSQVDINQLRNAVDLQTWLEMNARGGSRYIEQILYHFGIRVPDYQLQRPQYLGGGKSPVVISEVLQQSQTDTTPLGHQGGHALSVTNIHSFTHYFNEHGYIIGILSVIPKTCYQQGLPRLYSKFDKFDFFWPEFQHLGEQEIKQKEIYLSSAASDNEGTFGYTPRYAEYKFHNSEVHGDFRSSLNYWHLGRIFSSSPSLNKTFVHVDPSTLDRIFPVEVEPDSYQTIYAQIYCDNRWIRPMSKYGIPRL